MDSDIKRITKPLDTIIHAQSDNTSGETKIYFDNLHLSPLKVRFSFRRKKSLLRQEKIDSCEFFNAWITSQ